MLGGVIGVQAWLTYVFVKKQRVSSLNDVNHTVVQTGATQLNATLLLATEATRAKALGALFGNPQGLHPSARQATESHLLGLQVFRRAEGETFVEEKLSSEIPSLGFAAEMIGGFLSKAETLQKAFWQGAKPGENPRFFLATRIDAQTNDHSVIFIAVSEIDPELLYEHIQSASLFDTYFVDQTGKILFHSGGSDTKISQLDTDGVTELMKGRTPASSGLVTYRSHGQDWYGAVAPIANGDFYLLSRAGSSELGDELSPLIQLALALGAVALLASLFVSYFAKIMTNRLLAANSAPLDIAIPVSQQAPVKNANTIKPFVPPTDAKSVPAPAQIRVPLPPAPVQIPEENPFPPITEPEDDEITQTGFDIKAVNHEEHEVITQVRPIDPGSAETHLVDEDEDLRRLDE